MGELESIRVFLGVARHGSFAEAARHLGITPAAATRTIAALEDRLGVQLFLRTTRKVALTSAGAVYAARVGPLSEALRDAAEESQAQAGVASGRIRLNAPLSLGMKVLPAVLSQFRILYPQVTASVHLTDRFVDILQGDCDLAIRISGPPEDKSTIWRKICGVERVLVAAPAYLAQRGTPDDPAALSEHICLGYDAESHEEIWELSHAASTRRIRAGAGIAANNGELLAEMAAQGEGVALLPRFIVAADLAAGRLVQILPEWQPPEIWLTLYYPPYAHLPARVATFSDFFERYVTGERGLL